jgi:hypothetical protein
MIARNRFAVADTAIVEVGCYCGEGDRCNYCWDRDYPLIFITLTFEFSLQPEVVE